MSIALIDSALNQLRQTVLNYKLYPAGSAVVAENAQASVALWVQAVAEHPELVISDVEGRLFLNTETPLTRMEFRELMRQHDVQSLRFKPGIALEDIWILVQGLSRKAEDLVESGGLAGWLKANNAVHLEIEEYQFVAMRKGDDLLRQARQLFSTGTPTLEEFQRTLERIWHIWSESKEEEDRRAITDLVARQIMELPPALILDYLGSAAEQEGTPPGFRDTLSAAFATHKIAELIHELPIHVEEIRRHPGDPATRLKKLRSLERFIEKLQHSSGGLRSPAELFNMAHAEILRGAKDEGDDSSHDLPAKIQPLLEGPAEDLLSSRLENRWPEYVKILAATKNETLLSRLVVKIADNFKAPEAARREKTAEVLRQFEMWIAPQGLTALLTLLTQVTETHLREEVDPKTFAASAQNLQMAALDQLLNWKFDEAVRLLSVLRTHTLEETSRSPRHREAAQRSLVIFAQRSLGILMKDLLSQDVQAQLGAGQVLALLSGESVGPLLELLEKTDDPRLKQFAIQHLRRFVPQTRVALAQRLNAKSPADALHRVFPFLRQVLDASFVPLLEQILKHSDAKVRVEGLRLLALLPQSAEAMTLLTEALNDGDVSVQIQAVRLLRQMSLTAAEPELVRHLPDISQFVQEEICITLGEFKTELGLETLLEWVGDGGLFQKRSAILEPVRRQAVLALGQFLPHPKAEKAVQKAAKDKSPVIQTAARSILLRQKSL